LNDATGSLNISEKSIKNAKEVDAHGVVTRKELKLSYFNKLSKKNNKLSGNKLGRLNQSRELDQNKFSKIELIQSKMEDDSSLSNTSSKLSSMKQQIS
jgi:hypothetical protein